jgi:hypothetical protein
MSKSAADSHDDQATKALIVELCASTGRRVWHPHDLSHLGAGMYELRMRRENAGRTEKLE